MLEFGYSGVGKKENSDIGLPPYGSVNAYLINTGMGFSRTFGGCLEVMPFATLGYCYVHTIAPNTYYIPLNGNYVRIPMSVTLGLDLGYPVQLMFTAGYSPKIGFDFKNVKSPFEDNDALNKYMKERGTAFDGLFIRLGLQLNI
ncbi:MAG: hypothetical protein NC548_51940 [Lachnospiraceae bacterium]|nr:hypothetical protein [Lachnospiraceae bacterium]